MAIAPMGRGNWRVEILRDAYSIPHVTADSAEGALFGQGYTCGTDRAWQAEFMRLRGEGRTAEVFGRDGVTWDVFARRAGLEHAARVVFDASSARTQALLAAYVHGMNTALSAVDAVEFRQLGHRPAPWQDWTPITVFLAHHILFGRFTAKLWRAHACRALGPDVLDLFQLDEPGAGGVAARPGPGLVRSVTDRIFGRAEQGLPEANRTGAAGPGLDMTGGSNGWAVGGARTASGYPLVAGDPHRLLELPGIYQQTHLAAPEFDALGFAFVGVPGLPHFCHNGTVAWGITSAMADYQDLFVEDVVAGRVDRVEEIVVRDGPPVPVEVVRTDRGPVVLGGRDQGFALSLRSSLLEPDSFGFDAVLDLLFARTVDDVVDVLDGWVEPVNRVLIAGTDGRVVCRVAGRVPARSDENLWLPVPAEVDRYAWTGYLDRDRGVEVRPHEFAVVANQRMDTDMVPFTSEYAPACRADRIAELLRSERTVDAELCTRIHADTRCGRASALLALVASADGLTDAGRELQRRLLAWDLAMDATSHDALLYAELRARVVAALRSQTDLAVVPDAHQFGDVFDAWFSTSTRILDALDRILADPGRIGADVAGIARSCLDGLAADIEAGIGRVRGRTVWGDLHTAMPLHALDLMDVTTRFSGLSQEVRPHPLPLGGDRDCVQANSSVPSLGHACVFGSAARYYWDLSPRGANRWIVPLGASGDPASPHFEDQAPIWSRGAMVDAIRDWDVLRATSTATTVLNLHAAGR